MLVMMMVLPAMASDVQGRFAGKVECVGDKKLADFKTSTTALGVTHHSSQDIKRRIDALTWPTGNESLSFDDREKEKTELLHALKLLRDLSCDENADTATTAPDPTNTFGGSNHKQ
jgi:hypothetical protein